MKIRRAQNTYIASAEFEGLERSEVEDSELDVVEMAELAELDDPTAAADVVVCDSEVVPLRERHQLLS